MKQIQKYMTALLCAFVLAGMHMPQNIYAEDEIPQEETVTEETPEEEYGEESEQLEANDLDGFVTRLYQVCLGREPDKSGYMDWMNRLSTGKASAAVAVQGFMMSKEMQNKKLSNADFVEVCYHALMDRASDAGGKKNWVEKLNNGVSRNYILRGFIGSVEFTKLCSKYGVTRGDISLSERRDQNYGLTSFVGRLYNNALGRTPDAGGINNWCDLLILKKRTPKQVATTGFFHSVEFLKKSLNNTEFVKVLYRTFLDREYDTGGLNDWVGRLNNGEYRDTVLAGFADSKEFKNLIDKSGWETLSNKELAKYFNDVNSILLVANKAHKLPNYYEPSDMRQPNVSARMSTPMRDEAATALEEMFAAAKAQGVYLVAGSGFRSQSYQASLYNSYVARSGQAAADTYSARPGYSEHQTGLAMDISDYSGNTYLSRSFENTAEGKWLKYNAYKYGFIMRYPKTKQSITGYMYEPWHFRYVGKDYAVAMWSCGSEMTFEEYFGVAGGETYY